MFEVPSSLRAALTPRYDKEENPMKLYGSPISTCTRKVLCTLAEKSAQVEFINVDIFKGDQKNAEYVSAHQPFGKVPALDDDGFSMYESRAIIRYLDDTLPGTKLTPADAKGRAMMEQWTSVEYSYFSGPALRVAGERLFRPMHGMPTDEKKVEAAKVELTPVLEILEQRLTIQPHLAGQDFSLADIGYMPYIDYLVAAKEGEMITTRPHLAAWWKRISERPSWQKAIGKA
jgi:glutathione S-transferase